MEKDNKHLMEQELMEAFTYAKADADIGMPDIDAELLLVRKKAARPVRKSSVFTRIASVAASVVIVFTLGWTIISHLSDTEDTLANKGKDFCVAYVAGKRITDERQIMDMMNDDIMSMNNESDIIDDQLNEFFNE